MKKHIELSKREIIAVKNSIEHWKKDVQKPLLEGKKISNVGWDLKWEDVKRKVKCYGTHCPLCKLVKFGCSECPYTKKYNQACDDHMTTRVYKDGHWRKFLKNPNLKTCNNMIKALEEILK